MQQNRQIIESELETQEESIMDRMAQRRQLSINRSFNSFNPSFLPGVPCVNVHMCFVGNLRFSASSSFGVAFILLFFAVNDPAAHFRSFILIVSAVFEDLTCLYCRC